MTPEELKKEAEIAIFAGNALPEGAHPLAQAYAYHQFGHFNMLGDGRALLIGEQITPSGERFDIQLKGSTLLPIHAEEMVVLHSVRCYVNILLAKQCMHSIFQLPAV